MGVTITATQVGLEQRHAEEQVIAQSALIGERAVAITRLVLMVLMGVATSLVSQLTNHPLESGPYRKWVVSAYLLFSIGAVVATQLTTRAIIRRAIYLPLLFTVVDASFFFAMGAIDESLGLQARPEVATLSAAVLICFSVARARVFHVAFSTALSIAAVLFAGITQSWATWVWMTMVCFSLLSLGILIALTNLRIRRMFVDIRRRENLSRFLPRQVVERVLASGGEALKPVQREVTILFSDIRNFTTMSETMAPKEVLEFLDEYFGHMAQIVKGHDGMLNKFLGDGMLAVWGVPDLIDNHAEKALKAAVDMRKKMIEINDGRQSAGKAVFKIGIGVHTGMVAAGMLGGADQREYTVIGDAVNLASRIEGLTKSLGTDLLASQTTWSQGGAKFSGERVGEERVKGRDAAVVVYAVHER